MITFGDKIYKFEDLEQKILREESTIANEKDFIVEALRACFYALDGITIASGNSELLLVNEAYEDILGISADQLVGKTTGELVAAGAIERSVVELVMNSKKGETIIQTQKNGKIVLNTAKPLFDKKGNISRIVSTIRDMPMLKELYENLSKQETLLENYKQRLCHERKKDIRGVIAESAKMSNVLLLAEKMALSDSTVLILGESGVGKGVVAKFVHDVSRRGKKDIVSINCGAIPEQLLESELFGYCKGAFTGANSEGKMGLIEAAEGGTVVLDEIGELPLSLQAKLLTFLETGEIFKVGSTKAKKVDSRVIAVTNKNLKEMVGGKSFRADLYYRLNVIPIEVPPLRDRKEDIMPLALRFLKEYNQKNNCKKTIKAETLKKIEEYWWPGNVRELRNVIERTVVLSPNDEISNEDLPIEDGDYIEGKSQKEISWPISLVSLTKELEQGYIKMALKEGKSIRKAASLLGISPSALYRKINVD